MKDITIILLLIILVSCATVKYQIENFEDDFQRNQTIFSIDSLYLYIDNSPDHWFTFEIIADEVHQIENSQDFFMDNKLIQVTSIPFNIGKKYMVKGSLEAEKYALFKHMKWEEDYHKKYLKKDFESDNEYYTNEKNKQFLIWWFKISENSLTVSNDPDMIDFSINDSAEKTFNVTYMLCLEFVIQGKINASITVPVYEIERLKDEIEKIKKIADTLTFHGWYIDLDHLFNRIQSNEPYLLEDDLHTFSVKVPNFINIGATYFNDNMLLFGFPEKDNVINGVALTWDYKTDVGSFSEFINLRDQRLNDQRDNPIVIKEDTNEKRIYYTKDSAYFHCQEVFLKKEKVFIQLIFTATEETYNFNLEKFNELVENVK